MRSPAVSGPAVSVGGMQAVVQVDHSAPQNGIESSRSCPVLLLGGDLTLHALDEACDRRFEQLVDLAGATIDRTRPSKPRLVSASAKGHRASFSAWIS